MVAPVFPLFEIFRFFANAGAALRLARGKSRARHELTGDEEPREADGAANGDEDWIHLRARARARLVSRSFHSFPGHHATDASRRNDGTTDRGKEGTNETFPGPTAVRISHDERTIGARSFARNPPPRSVYTPRRDGGRRDERRTTHLWAKPTLSERHVESKRVFVLWRVSRDARPVVPRAGTTDAFVCSSPRRGREGVHLGSRIGES